MEKEYSPCEGNCKETHGRHQGAIQRVKIVAAQPSGVVAIGWEWNYCQNAIEEDTERGFTLEILEDVPQEARKA